METSAEFAGLLLESCNKLLLIKDSFIFYFFLFYYGQQTNEISKSHSLDEIHRY